MIFNIPKFNTGGYLYHSTYAPSVLNSQSLDSSKVSKTKKDSSESPIVAKSTWESLMKNALPNDVRYFSAMVKSISNNFLTGEPDKGKISDLNAYGALIIYLKQRYDSAVKSAEANESWGETAVTARNQVYAMNENGDIKLVPLSEFDSTSLTALTVGELLRYRAEDDRFKNRSDMVDTALSTIGMSKISEYIKDIVDIIGQSESKTEAYRDLATIAGLRHVKPTDKEYQALKEMETLFKTVGADAIFKVGTNMKRDNTEAAFNYLLNIMPTQMKNLLVANYVTQLGGSYEDASKHVLNVLGSALNTAHSESFELTMSFNEALNPHVKDRQNYKRQNSTELLFNLNLNRQKIVISNPSARNQYALSTQGTVIPRLSLDNGDAADSGVLRNKLEANGKGMMKYLNTNNTYFGEDKMNPLSLGQVYYNGDAVANVLMPVNGAGDIDWLGFRAHSIAEDEIASNNITDPREKNKIHMKYLSATRYDSNGQANLNRPTKLFLMTHGYTSDDNLSAENSMYTELEGAEESAFRDAINLEADKENAEIDSVWWIELFYRDIVKVPIFIEVAPNASLNAAYYSHKGSRVNDSTIQQDMIQQQMLLTPTIPINAGASNLYTE